MATIREFFQNLLYQVPAIGITDIVDILVVSIIFYSLLRLIRSTSAARVARAILLAAGHHAADRRSESLYIKLAAQQDP